MSGVKTQQRPVAGTELRNAPVNGEVASKIGPAKDPERKDLDAYVVKSTKSPLTDMDTDPKVREYNDKIGATETHNSGGEVLAAAGGSGDDPRKPTDPKKSHYYDIDEIGYQPVRDLKGIRMADPNGVRRPQFIDPAKRSETSAATREMALRQTTAARDMLYHPGDTLRGELAGAAGAMYDIAIQLDQRDQRTLGTRILGPEGLLPNQQPNRLLETLRRVRDDPQNGEATAHDRAAVIALMGDVGALYADTGATTGVEGRSDRMAAILRGRLRHHLTRAGLDPVTPRVVQDTQALGGSKAVGPTKKNDRIRSDEKPPRTGIHNLGEEADENLGIDDDDALPATRWNVAEIRTSRVDGTEEPLVGHMSGSPAEILQVWDMLLGVPADEQYTGVMQHHRGELTAGREDVRPMEHLDPAERNRRTARAAGAAGFLVGLGYHSAVEVMEGTLAYTGQDSRGALPNPRQDAGHLFGRGAATDLMSDMFEGQTQRPQQQPPPDDRQ